MSQQGRSSVVDVSHERRHCPVREEEREGLGAPPGGAGACHPECMPTPSLAARPAPSSDLGPEASSTPDAVPSPPLPEKKHATPLQTREALTKQAGRGYTVIRNSFVQVREAGRWRGSSLGRLVTARQPRALLAYLLLLMLWNALDRRAKPLEAPVWARALSPDPPAAPWPEKAMTPVWAFLEQEPHPLITKARKARLVKPSPRQEDGKAAYVRPRPDVLTGDEAELFFALPDAFWLEGWHHRLTLPGIAVLLILLHGTQRRDEARLSPDRAADWYDVSTKTMEKGLEDLRKHDLIKVRTDWVEAPLSKIGTTKHTYYRLTGVFSRQGREELQQAAAAATKQREGKANRRTHAVPPAPTATTATTAGAS